MPFPRPQPNVVPLPDLPEPVLPLLPSGQIDVDQLRRIINAAPLLLSYIDASLHYRFLNRRYSEWFGHTQDEMLGQHVLDIVGPAAYEKVLPHLTAALRGNTVVYESQMPYADGTRYVRISLVPDRDGKGNVLGMVAVVTDITDRHNAEEKLAESEARYRSLFEHNNDAVFSFAADGAFLSANTAGERLTGYAPRELLQMSFRALTLPDYDAVTTNGFAAALHGETSSYENAIRHRDGQVVNCSVTNGPIIVNGKIVGVYGIARDITEQKRAERLLAEAGEKQRRFVREMLYSMTEGRLRLCNSPDDLPAALPELCPPLALNRSSLRSFRRQVVAAAEAACMDDERAQDFITAIGEASMNAVVHAGGGEAQVCGDLDAGILQIWVQDAGAGINEDALHRATLEKGFSSAGTLGHGFWMMLKTADRIYLLTGPSGTTVVLEQERQLPDPLWLRTK